MIFIYGSIFISYRFYGHFLKNEYLDKNYLIFKEKEYSAIRNKYEDKYRRTESAVIAKIKNERTHRISIPSLNYGKYKKGTTGIKSKASETDLASMKKRPNFKPLHVQIDEEKSNFDESKIENIRKQWLWDMRIYNSSLDKSISDLNESEIWMRYAMGKEIGKLGVFSTAYIITPIYVGSCFITAIIYRRLWSRLRERIIEKMEKHGQYLNTVNYITY